MSATQAGRMMQIMTPFEEDFLLINKLEGEESLSKLFSFELELLHDEGEDSGHDPTVISVEKILGQEVEVTVAQRDGTSRTFHGIINQFSQGNRDGRFSYFYATMVPSIWILTQRHQSRIFQQMTVPEILQDVLADFNVLYELQGEFKQRNYCVQYRETDFDFISRLMEEEGIYYYFKHEGGTHQMIVGNASQTNLDCPSKNELECFLEVSPDEDWVSSIGTWRVDYRLQTGKVTFWDFHFQMPKKNFEGTQPALTKVGGNDKLEYYDYPGGYARKYDGVEKAGGENASDLANIDADREKTSKTRIQELDAKYRAITGLSDCCSLTAGHRFKLSNHPQASYNTQYVLTYVKHEIEQSPDYETDEENLRAYGNSFNCLIYTTPYRPEQATPKPIVRGSQTAVVVGPAGEEIFTDKYGRVKVQFFWDREGKLDSNSSCWVRVAQGWAGKNWGTMFIPRIGMEVLVDFLEGNPDQPIITGCVYNAEAMPPYKLPDEKTKMTIKSDSTLGGQGFNEFRFEDKKGSEQIFIHGEKDLDLRIKNDRREWTGKDQHSIVINDRREKIDQDTHLKVGRHQIEEIGGDKHLHVKGEEAIKIDGGLSIEVAGTTTTKLTGGHSSETGGGYHIKGQIVLIEGMMGVTIKGPGGFITIGPAGIFINGTMVFINSGGAPLSVAPTSLTPPQAPAVADKADDDKPGSKTKLERTSEGRKEKRHKEDETKKSWIKIKMVNEAGEPVPGVRYRVTTPSGRVASGTLNKEGKAEVKGIDPGNCQVTFPDLDKDAWEEA
jgi:type VI secretion system secreted protein VgrG